VTPVDASRAGDTFGGAFTARLLADTDPRRQDRQPSFTGIESLNGVGHVTPDGNLPAPDTLRFGLDRQAEAADAVIAANRNGTADSWKIVAPNKVGGRVRLRYDRPPVALGSAAPAFTHLVDTAKTELKTAVVPAQAGLVTAVPRTHPQPLVVPARVELVPGRERARRAGCW
jgi:hypothetical protein